MTGRILGLILFCCVTAACDDPHHSTMVGPTPVGTGMFTPSAASAMAGAWSGTFSDMGGTAMVDWVLSPEGSRLSGRTSWTDGHGSHDGWTFSGVMMSNTEMRFTWSSPGGHMIGRQMMTCPVEFHGTGHLGTDASGHMRIEGTYGATSSCQNPIDDGRFVLERMP